MMTKNPRMMAIMIMLMKTPARERAKVAKGQRKKKRQTTMEVMMIQTRRTMMNTRTATEMEMTTAMGMKMTMAMEMKMTTAMPMEMTTAMAMVTTKMRKAMMPRRMMESERAKEAK